MVSQMLSIMREEAETEGHQVESVMTNDLHVRPCTGCMTCRKTGECVLAEDDSQRVLRMMQQAEAIIIGAPCYWGNIPGQMKLLFDRLVYGMMRDTSMFPAPLMKGKKCVLVSTCTTPWPWNIWFNQSHGAIRALREICQYSGFRIVKVIELGGTAQNPHLSDRMKRKCRKAMRGILRMCMAV